VLFYPLKIEHRPLMFCLIWGFWMQPRQKIPDIGKTVVYLHRCLIYAVPGNTKGGRITVLLASCLTGLESVVWLLTIFVFICKTNKSKPVKQEVNCTVILPPLVFPGCSIDGEKSFNSLAPGMLHWLACVDLGWYNVRSSSWQGCRTSASCSAFDSICNKYGNIYIYMHMYV
jgi:hypothetical protein